MTAGTCPTTGLRYYTPADIARSVADELSTLTAVAYEAWRCPDADHWHVRMTPPPRRRWWWPW